MKLILFVVFNLIALSSISSKNLKVTAPIKGSNSQKSTSTNPTKTTTTTKHDTTQSKKDQTKKDQTKKDQTKKDQTKKDQTKKDQTKKDQTKPDQTKRDTTKLTREEKLKKLEEVKRKKEEERKRLEEERKKKREEKLKKLEEIKRKKAEEEMKRKKEEELRKKKEEEERKKQSQPKFTNSGTGIETISYQKSLGLKEGCNFMACCVIGGLTTDQEILKAHDWALQHNYIRSDNYVNISYSDFAKKISKEFKTTYHDDWKRGGSAEQGHFWVEDGNGKEIFNSAGLYYHGGY